MRSLMVISSLVVVVGLLAGCGSGGGGGGVSCDLTTAGAEVCTEYSGDGVTDAVCPSPGKIVDACPSANALGTCTQTTSTATAAVTYYKATGLTADTLKTACTSGGGTWK